MSTLATDTRTLLSVNVRDERNVEEWLKWHIDTIGFDHVLLFDDRSTVLLPADMIPVHVAHKVTLRRQNMIKTAYMNTALQFARDNGYVFLFHIDADEYLDIPISIHSLLKDILQKHPFFLSVSIPWLHYGSNYLEKDQPSSFLTAYTRCAAYCEALSKPIVRVEHASRAINPHQWEWRCKLHSPPEKGAWFVDVEGNNVGKHGHSYACFQEWEATKAKHVLAHFSQQSWAEFCRRRCRPRDDTRCKRRYEYDLDASRPAPVAHHEAYNEVQRPLRGGRPHA